MKRTLYANAVFKSFWAVSTNKFGFFLSESACNKMNVLVNLVFF